MSNLAEPPPAREKEFQDMGPADEQDEEQQRTEAGRRAGWPMLHDVDRTCSRWKIKRAREDRPVWFSARAQSEIARFENSRLWPGAIADAMVRWAGTVHGPARRLTDPVVRGCGVEACCPSDAHPRGMLEQALCGLPAGASRELWCRFSRLMGSSLHARSWTLMSICPNHGG
ncbi:hypothetical protein Acor_73900 [Acrocarpospora corrugata]|uniref:Uncharacterized protein n=1 Tax=Acrocarpospora corrugata TaxID=35763 RepID=A0A5M3WBA9_9ACTN|nr:hypothetical protein Acor_73900 [Acrocarpospora corrugata]